MLEDAEEPPPAAGGEAAPASAWGKCEAVTLRGRRSAGMQLALLQPGRPTMLPPLQEILVLPPWRPQPAQPSRRSASPLCPSPTQRPSSGRRLLCLLRPLCLQLLLAPALWARGEEARCSPTSSSAAANTVHFNRTSVHIVNAPEVMVMGSPHGGREQGTSLGKGRAWWIL